MLIVPDTNSSYLALIVHTNTSSIFQFDIIFFIDVNIKMRSNSICEGNMSSRFYNPLFHFIILLLIIYSCGIESPEERLYNQLPFEVKSCITDRNKIVHGIDVSYYQGTIDWNKVAQEGHKFAFIRVSDGLNYIDSKFLQNWSGAKTAGIIRGAYQFFRPNLDAIQQAQLLLDKMGALEKGDLPPVIDVENTGNLTPSEVSTQVGKWIDYVESKLGVKPIIYTGYYFWKDNVKSTAFGEYLLWLAWYHDYQDTSFCPTTPDPWKKWTFWQWTSSGTVAGISGYVDRNIFDGTLEDLRKLTYLYEDVCGDSYCSEKETYQNCPSDCLMIEFIMPKDGEELINPVLFMIEADSNIVKVNYYADGYLFGTSTKAENYFAIEYSFNTLGERNIIAEGFNNNGKRIGAASINIKVLPPPNCGDGECNGKENFSNCDLDCVNITFITPKDGDIVHNPVTFKVNTPESVKSIIYTADIYKFATSSDKNSDFEVTYKFNVLGSRTIIADAFNENQKRIGTTSINITVLEEEDASINDISDIDTDTNETIEDTGNHDSNIITTDYTTIDTIVEVKGNDEEIPDTTHIAKDVQSIDSRTQQEHSSSCGCTIIE